MRSPTPSRSQNSSERFEKQIARDPSPIRSASSSSTTRWPRCARSIASDNPTGPAPTTTIACWRDFGRGDPDQGDGGSRTGFLPAPCANLGSGQEGTYLLDSLTCNYLGPAAAVRQLEFGAIFLARTSGETVLKTKEAEAVEASLRPKAR